MAKTVRRARTELLPPPPEQPISESPADSVTSRLSVPLTTSGLIDFDNMRPSNRDKLKAALSDSQLVRELGLAPATATPKVAALDAGDTALFTSLLNMLYDGIASAAIVSARARGMEPDVAELLRVTAKEKQDMCDAHIALLAKYNITSGAYGVEINAAASVAMVVLAKYAAIKAALAAKAPTPQAQAAA